jgi:uncharacterized caspase-like protein
MLRQAQGQPRLTGIVEPNGGAAIDWAFPAALVIGNSSYADGAPLRHPVGDARAVADQLRRSWFSVDFGENLSRQDMLKLVDRFAGRIRRGSTALLFFSGYGIQAGKQGILRAPPSSARNWSPSVLRCSKKQCLRFLE